MNPNNYNNKLNSYWKKKIKNNEKINLYHLTKYYILSEDLLYKYLNEFKEGDWENITKCQKLSENFIRNNYHLFDSFQFSTICWMNISYFQELSEEFIVEFYEKLDLYLIGCSDFINEEKLNSLIIKKKLTT